MLGDAYSFPVEENLINEDIFYQQIIDQQQPKEDPELTYQQQIVEKPSLEEEATMVSPSTDEVSDDHPKQDSVQYDTTSVQQEERVPNPEQQVVQATSLDDPQKQDSIQYDTISVKEERVPNPEQQVVQATSFPQEQSTTIHEMELQQQAMSRELSKQQAVKQPQETKVTMNGPSSAANGKKVVPTPRQQEKSPSEQMPNIPPGGPPPRPQPNLPPKPDQPRPPPSKPSLPPGTDLESLGRIGVFGEVSSAAVHASAMPSMHILVIVLLSIWFILAVKRS